MAIYWTLSSIPEFAGVDKETRKAALRACRWKVFRHWQAWAGPVIVGLAAGAGFLVGGLVGCWAAGIEWDWASSPLPLLIGAFVGGPVAAGIAGGVYGQTMLVLMRPYLRGYLEERRVRSKPGTGE